MSSHPDLIRSSVTRFGKNSPLRQSFKWLWQIWKGPLSIWQHFEHILAKSYWAKFQCCKWPNIENVIKPSGHPDQIRKIQPAWKIENRWCTIATYLQLSNQGITGLVTIRSGSGCLVNKVKTNTLWRTNFSIYFRPILFTYLLGFEHMAITRSCVLKFEPKKSPVFFS